MHEVLAPYSDAKIPPVKDQQLCFFDPDVGPPQSEIESGRFVLSAPFMEAGAVVAKGQENNHKKEATSKCVETTSQPTTRVCQSKTFKHWSVAAPYRFFK